MYAGILHCTQNGRSVSAYYGQLEGMWEEINVYHPLTNNLETMRKQREEFKVAKFLSGLDLEFASVRNTILSSEELPSMSSAYSRLQRVSHGAPTESPPNTKETKEVD